jgi:hypothetical protein
MIERNDRIDNYDEDAALASFEGEGGALAEGPQVRSKSTATSSNSSKAQRVARSILGNAYVSGVAAAALYDLLRLAYKIFVHMGTWN